MANLYVYVDGESHFIRSEESWKRAKSNAATLEILAETNPASPGFHHVYRPFPERPSGDHRRFLLKRDAGFFWDSFLPGLSGIPNPRVSRAVYFTACSADDPTIHAVKEAIRGYGFDPVVIKETKDKRKQRENARAQGLLQKAKGVDIALTVRMLKDAYRGLYDACLFLTSDADYIPLIEAVREVGKVVYVLGYKPALAKKSPFEYVPDKFVDLDEIMVGMEWSGVDRDKIASIAGASEP